MAETVSQHAQGAFTTPANEDDGDADVVRANDNAVRVKHNDHDSDSGIHVQSSALASRPVAGTAGRKWVTVDSGVVRFFYDTGVAWVEVDYIRTAGAGVAGDWSVGDDLAVTDDATIGGDLAVTGAVTGASFAGGGSGLTGLDAGELTGALPAISGAALTALTSSALSGTLPAISGANLTHLDAGDLENALPAISGAALTSLNATNVASGTLDNARLPSAISVTSFTGAVNTDDIANLGATVSLNLNDADARFLTVGASGAQWLDTSAPTGVGTKYYLKIIQNGIEYKILCTPTS